MKNLLIIICFGITFIFLDLFCIQYANALPNPSDAFCIQKGGHLKFKEKQRGQYAICQFDDGSECEAWEFFRRACEKIHYEGEISNYSCSSLRLYKENTVDKCSIKSLK